MGLRWAGTPSRHYFQIYQIAFTPTRYINKLRNMYTLLFIGLNLIGLTMANPLPAERVPRCQWGTPGCNDFPGCIPPGPGHGFCHPDRNECCPGSQCLSLCGGSGCFPGGGAEGLYTCVSNWRGSKTLVVDRPMLI